jgi:hypothetical protein
MEGEERKEREEGRKEGREMGDGKEEQTVEESSSRSSLRDDKVASARGIRISSGNNLGKIKESETWLNAAHVTILDLTSATQDLSARLT